MSLNAGRSRPQALWQKALLLAALCCAALPVACKKKPPPPADKPLPETPELAPDEGSAEPLAPKPPPAPRCQELPGVATFRIGESSASAAHAEEDDAGSDDEDDVPLPFSVEIGQARAEATRFVAAALRSAKGGSHSLLAVLKTEPPAALKLVDLGAVHGDPDPPAFAAHGADVLVALSDTDAGGAMLRIGLVRDVQGAASVSFGPELTGVRRDSPFSLEVSGERALLVYASLAHDKVRLQAAAFSAAQLPSKLTPEPISPGDADVDEPRLAPRKGGFWLASARALPTEKGKPKSPAPAASADEADPSLVEDVARRIEISALDLAGKPQGVALAVSQVSESALTFDLAAAPDGSAYIAFRTDDTTPGSDGGPLRLVHVKLDGTLERVSVLGDEQGTGAPTLLLDAASGALWLIASGSNGATWFGKVSDHTELHSDEGVRGASLLGIQGGHWLSERTRGTAAELSLLACPGG